MVVKAFISYCTLDKVFVEKVVKKLGRATVNCDFQSFSPGDDLRDSIKESLKNSKLYVLFASKKSLESFWVKWEINLAEWGIITGDISKGLTIIIDDDIDHNNLPIWMQHSLIRTEIYPTLAAYTINEQIITVTQQLEPTKVPIIAGRIKDLEEIADKLIPHMEHNSPKIIAVSGLEGIGRKTFIQRALKDYLKMSTGPTYSIDEEDTIENLYVKILNDTIGLENRDKYVEHIKEFQRLNINNKGIEIVRLLKIFFQENRVPFILDSGHRGTILDDDNWFKEEWLSIMAAVNETDGAFLVFILPRLINFPKLMDFNNVPYIATQRLNPINDKAIELVLRGLFRNDIKANEMQIQELAPFLNGYPRAVTYAYEYSKLYGLDQLLANKAILTDFFYKRFSPYIEKLNLNEKEIAILRLLASEEQVTIEVINTVFDFSIGDSSKFLTHLIDLCLVIQIDGNYILSSPIESAISNKWGLMNNQEYGRIAEKLISKYWSEKTKLIDDVSVIAVTIHSLAHIERGSTFGKLGEFRDMILPGHLLKVARQKYNSQFWTDAENLCNKTLELDPSSLDAKIILFRCLVRQQKWPLAEALLREIDQTFNIKRHYLRGFLLWKQGDLFEAARAFRRGYEAGDESVSILRDLSFCLFHSGQIAEAKIDIKIARSRYPQNEFVLDLAALIAIYTEDDRDVMGLINELKAINVIAFNHRMASFKSKKKEWPEAILYAEQACVGEKPRFEALAQRADILIELHDPSAEKAIRALEPLEISRKDIKSGLLCKYFLRNTQWQRAERAWQQISHKDLPSPTAQRISILRLKLQNGEIPTWEKDKVESEISSFVPIELPLSNDTDDVDG